MSPKFKELDPNESVISKQSSVHQKSSKKSSNKKEKKSEEHEDEDGELNKQITFQREDQL